MERLRQFFKRLEIPFGIFWGCMWLLLWSVGSWKAGRVLSLDEVMPAADRWLGLKP
jgi:hypothetical protein